MKVAIDPGHGQDSRKQGRYDPGAVHVENGVQYTEAEIVLDYALTLRDIFNAHGHQTFMTREKKADSSPLKYRVSNAAKAGADVLLSLHLNSVANDQANGVLVCYNDQNDKKLAQALQPALVKATGMADRGLQQRTGLAILKFNGPAALIELGFLPNDHDRNILLNPQKKKDICEAIATTVINHALKP